MAIFLVRLLGQNLRMQRDGRDILAGFYINEYVQSETERDAIAAADANVRRKITEKLGIPESDFRDLSLTVDTIEPNVPAGNSEAGQGFIFFEMDRPS